MERRRVLAAVAGAWAWAWVGAAGLVAGTAQAAEETFPSKPIQLIIPFGAGGSHDLHARVLASVAPQYLGQPLIVVLRPGGGGAIASQFVARSAPDGYTLLFGGNGPNTILPIVQNVGYGMREFVPVAQINYSPPLLVVRPDAPWKDAREFIEDARQRPNRILFAHTGVYGAAHFPMLLVQEATGVRVTFVSYDGGGPALLAVASRNADASFLFAAQVLPYWRAGRVKVLGVAAPARLESLPDVPTLKEQGIDVEFRMWRAVLAPAGISQDRLRVLREAFRKVVDDPSFKALMRQLDEPIIYMDGPEFAEFWRQEWESVRKAAQAVLN